MRTRFNQRFLKFIAVKKGLLHGYGAAAPNYEVFLVQQFLQKMLPRVKGRAAPCRRPQTAKYPAPFFWRAEKRGEKCDSISRGKRTRPLSPCFSDETSFPCKRSGGTFTTNINLSVLPPASQLSLKGEPELYPE